MTKERYFWQKVVLCACFVGWTLYAYIDKVNQVTKARIIVPQLQKEHKMLQEENRRLAFQIQQFADPKHLIELAKQPEFGHLHYPVVSDVCIVKREDSR